MRVQAMAPCIRQVLLLVRFTAHLAKMEMAAEPTDMTTARMVVAATIGTNGLIRPAPSSLETRVLAAPVQAQ